MKVLKLGKGIKTKKYECENCGSVLSYTKYDIKTYRGNWTRVGVEESICDCIEYIRCPVCNTQIILKSWTEEF